MSSAVERKLNLIHQRMKECRKCPQMCGTAVHGPGLDTRILIVGQAPGAHEESRGKPFAHTAGKTLFKWLHQATGASEEEIRDSVYFSAVARCFPGKAKSGSGDRPPSFQEIQNCREHLAAEVDALKPKLVLAIGRIAISEVLGEKLFDKAKTLNDVVGEKFSCQFHGEWVDVIPLPHPSGVSRWPQTEPGKTKLDKALRKIAMEMKKHSE